MNQGALSPTLSHQDEQQENARAILFSKKMQYLMLPPHHPSPSPTLDISLQSRSPCQVLPLKADGVEVTNINTRHWPGAQGVVGRAGEAGLALLPEKEKQERLFGLAQAQ